MPSKFVFPGGKLDIADQRLNLYTALPPVMLTKLRKYTRDNPSDKKLTGLALAAIRETFEETGLVIGRKTDVITRSKNTSWQAYFNHGVEPALEKMEFIARAITPTYRVRRFDTRFFLVNDTSIYANLDAPANPSGELEDVRWIPLTETRGLDLPGVTRWVLEQVEMRLGASSSFTGKFPIPFVQFVNGTTLEKPL